MPTKLAFVHTGHVLIPTFGALAKQILPEFETFHMLDESLIKNTIAAKTLTTATIRRLIARIGLAHAGGADAVMVTCSSIGAGVKVAREVYDFPVLRVDEAMAEAAVEGGKRIGVAATLSTTLEPTIQLIRDTAAAHGREVEIIPTLCQGAFEALVIAGETERHDSLVQKALAELRAQVDIIVLAQASMARVLPKLPAIGAPILSSPELALRKARSLLLSEAAERPCGSELSGKVGELKGGSCGEGLSLECVARSAGYGGSADSRIGPRGRYAKSDKGSRNSSAARAKPR